MTRPFCWKLFPTLSPGSVQLQAAPPPKHLSSGVEGQQVAGQYQGTEVSRGSPAPPNPRGHTSCAALPTSRNSLGPDFIPYKTGVAISTPSTLHEANARIQGVMEGGRGGAAGSTRQYSFQAICRGESGTSALPLCSAFPGMQGRAGLWLLPGPPTFPSPISFRDHQIILPEPPHHRLDHLPSLSGLQGSVRNFKTERISNITQSYI